MSALSERALNELALTTNVSSEGRSLSLDGSELVCVVQDGDATLVVRHVVGAAAKRFSVSAIILKLASQYFDRLFYGHMAEAQALANAKPVIVNLDGDDPSAVEVILRVLHHQRQDSSVNLGLELLASTTSLRCWNPGSLSGWMHFIQSGKIQLILDSFC